VISQLITAGTLPTFLSEDPNATLSPSALYYTSNVEFHDPDEGIITDFFPLQDSGKNFAGSAIDVKNDQTKFKKNDQIKFLKTLKT